MKDKQKTTHKGQAQVKPEVALETCRILTELHKLQEQVETWMCGAIRIQLVT
jgi:hypothetical protein